MFEKQYLDARIFRAKYPSDSVATMDNLKLAEALGELRSAFFEDRVMPGDFNALTDQLAVMQREHYNRVNQADDDGQPTGAYDHLTDEELAEAIGESWNQLAELDKRIGHNLEKTRASEDLKEMTMEKNRRSVSGVTVKRSPSGTVHYEALEPESINTDFKGGYQKSQMSKDFANQLRSGHTDALFRGENPGGSEE